MFIQNVADKVKIHLSEKANSDRNTVQTTFEVKSLMTLEIKCSP